MSEYIIKIPHECFSECDGVIHDRYYPDERHDPMPLEEIVRCRDCKYYEAVPEDAGDWCGYWTDRVYGTDGFCAWGKRKVDA